MTTEQAAQLASLKPEEWKSGAVGHTDYETRKTEQRDPEPTVNKEGEDPARRHCVRLHHVSRWRVINVLISDLHIRSLHWKLCSKLNSGSHQSKSSTLCANFSTKIRP